MMTQLRLAVRLLILWAVATPVVATPMQHLDGHTMGTTWSVHLALPPAVSAEELQRGIQAELDRVDRQMSTYKPQSALSRFNRAPGGSWHTLPPEFFDVLQRALQLAKDSDGAYDPTVGPLVNCGASAPTSGHVSRRRQMRSPGQRRGSAGGS